MVKLYHLLPSKLEQLRKEKSYSQKQIAQALGISEAMYSRVESGERLVQEFHLKKISELLGFEYSELRALILADKIIIESANYTEKEIMIANKILQNNRIK